MQTITIVIPFLVSYYKIVLQNKFYFYHLYILHVKFIVNDIILKLIYFIQINKQVL